MKKPSATAILEKGVSGGVGVGRVTPAEQTRLRRQRRGEPHFLSDVDHEALDRLRRCKDVVADWGDQDVGFFSLFQPRVRMTVSEWADRHRIVPRESSARAGQWRTQDVPALRGFMDACSPSHRARRVVLAKGNQVGGSECLINLVCFGIACDPRNMIIAFPNAELSAAFATERLQPSVALIPALRGKLTDEVVDSETRIRTAARRLRFSGGSLTMAGAASIASLTSRACAIAIMDETDLCLQSCGQGGNPIKAIEARASSFFDAKVVYVGAPLRSVEESGIESLYQDSNQGTLEHLCPDPQCGCWQPLSWEAMNVTTARLACQECGTEFSQSEWHRASADGIRWAFANPDHEVIGFRISALDAGWLPWRALCNEFTEATRLAGLGDISALKDFYSGRLAKPYRVLRSSSETASLYQRREVYSCHASGCELPAEVCVVTAGVDIGEKAISYEIVAWGRDRQSWGIEADEILGSPHVGCDPEYPMRSP